MVRQLGKYVKPDEEQDAINHPKHYTQGSMETIDIIFNVIEPIDNPNVAMCIGNSIKYLSRFTHKGKPVEDLKKAVWYINKAIEEMEK